METQDLCEGCLSFHPRAKFKTYTSLQYSLPKSTQSETCIFVPPKKESIFSKHQKTLFKQPTNQPHGGNVYFHPHHLGKDSLGGTSKTLMFVNCSPARWERSNGGGCGMG